MEPRLRQEGEDSCLGNKLKARHEGFVKEQPELFGQLVKNLSSTHFEKAPDFFINGIQVQIGRKIDSLHYGASNEIKDF